MLAFPKILFPLTVLQNPENSYIRNIQSIFYDFLWDSKPDKIARNPIKHDYPDSRLKRWILSHKYMVSEQRG